MRTTTLSLFLSTAALTAPTLAQGGAPDYTAEVILSGLERPTGITVVGNRMLFFTELPTPGVPGTMGGTNRVQRYSLNSESLQLVTMGEPEPTNLAVGAGQTLYWTCKSAGVVLSKAPNNDPQLLLDGLDQPSGIAIGRWGEVYFTQIPTPGLPGTMGGTNTVNVFDGTDTTMLTLGEPEPTDVAAARDGRTLYWTCKSAGVILKRDTQSGTVEMVLSNLASPTGITIDRRGRFLYFTEVPTPGVPGTMGGTNRVLRHDLMLGVTDEVNVGDPEPTDVTVAPDGTLYWTCTSAGVIVKATLN